MSKKVLIIDDDADFVEAMTTLLEAKDYDVVSASNRQEGVAKAKSESPNIVLLDVMMATKTDGFDAAKELKSDPLIKNIPVVMITGVRKDMNLSFGLEPDEDWLPVKAVLEKPVKPELLLKTIAEHIRA